MIQMNFYQTFIFYVDYNDPKYAFLHILCAFLFWEVFATDWKCMTLEFFIWRTLNLYMQYVIYAFNAIHNSHQLCKTLTYICGWFFCFFFFVLQLTPFQFYIYAFMNYFLRMFHTNTHLYLLDFKKVFCEFHDECSMFIAR